MSRFHVARSTVILTVVSLLVTVVAAPVSAAKPGGKPSADREVLFASDGMRPDLMETYAAAGVMPTYAGLMAQGVRGDNGMVQAFPPNTGVGWYTIATGTYPGEHGSTNNTFFRSGDVFSNRTSFSGVGALQADTIANAAERAGKKVAQIEWVGGRSAAIAGPTVDFANFFSTRGVLTTPVIATEQNGAAAFGVSYQVPTFAAAAGWSNVPAGDPAAPPQQASLTVATSFATQNPTRLYDLYVYDSVVDGTPAYDSVLMVRSAAAKDGSQAATTLAVGDFNEVKLSGADGLIGTRAGQTAGFYVKLTSMAGDLSAFKLYFTSIERVIASCATAACNALPAGGAGEDRLEKYLADNLPTAVSADFAPEEAGIIDEDTYVEQGRDLEVTYGDAVLNYILHDLQPDTDLAMVGYPFTDEVSHQFMALVTPTDIDGNPNPCFDVVPKFDDVVCTGGGTAGRVAAREGYIRSAYAAADAKLALARSLMGGDPTTVAASDHGFAPQWWAVNANQILNQTTVRNTVTNIDVSLHASNGNASNCGAATTDLAKGCWAGGTIQIYVNTTLPSGITNAAVRTAATAAFSGLTDPANPSAQVVARVMQKEELRNVDGSDSLNPNRSGDVVVVLRPPYQADSGTNGQAIALSHFFGQHGYLPELVDLAHNVNMHATFVAAGPGFRHQGPVSGIRAIDIAPTLAFLLGVDGPQNARGQIRVDLTTNPSLKVYSILDISDYHGQLVPLTEAPDTLVAPATNPSFTIGGAAFLKPWFDVYRAESQDGSITVAAGDSVGATPPISSFFGDTPTIELMNAMGFNADGLGNHNFDKGQTYLRNTLIPLANYPFLSANVVDSKGKTPKAWQPSTTFKFGLTKIGLIGFTNEDAPSLVFPNAFDPFHVAPRLSTVQPEVDKLSHSVDAVVVMGHDGATGGTLTNPTGPLLDLADQLQNVDVVIGDHTDVQVISRRSNGVLVTENRSKGIRFTRIRLVVDQASKSVVYTTADFHKPWDIGITPDAAIQARIDDLNSQLAPIFSIVIGSATKVIPRADQCGGSTGRLCESLVGDVVTDAIRTTYAPIGVEFAITNSGGLRADLTCPTFDNPSDFCPGYTPPPYPISRGQVNTVLPFGNVAVTLTVNGAELKSMLERGVSAMPAADGRFPQVSGLCFTYDIEAAAGSRMTGAVRADADGNCTTTALDLTAASTYMIVSNDFTISGGDGYPNFSGRMHTQAILDQVTADYISAQSAPLNPTVKAAPDGRINCFDPNPGTAPDCAALVPSP